VWQAGESKAMNDGEPMQAKTLLLGGLSVHRTLVNGEPVGQWTVTHADGWRPSSSQSASPRQSTPRASCGQGPGTSLPAAVISSSRNRLGSGCSCQVRLVGYRLSRRYTCNGRVRYAPLFAGLIGLCDPGRTIARGSEGDRGLDIGSIARQYRAMTATPTDAIRVVNDGRRAAAPVNVSR